MSLGHHVFALILLIDGVCRKLGFTKHGQETVQITTVYEPPEGNVCSIVDFSGCICMRTPARPVLHFELGSVIDLLPNEVQGHENVSCTFWSFNTCLKAPPQSIKLPNFIQPKFELYILHKLHPITSYCFYKSDVKASSIFSTQTRCS